MTTLRTYDDLLATGPIRYQVGSEVFEFTPEAPIDVALEWIDYNTNPERLTGDTKAVRMRTNYVLVFGQENYDGMVAKGLGSKTLDEMYLDLLEDWSLWSDPDRALAKQGVRPIAEILAELRVALAHTDDDSVAEAAAEMALSVETMLESAGADTPGE